MSVTLTFVVPGHDLSQIADALIRALPELAPVPGQHGWPEPVFTLTSMGDDITLVVPGGTDEGAVAAVVAAHVPQTRYDPATLLRERAPLLRENRRRATFRRVREAADGATADDLKRALLLLTDWLERETETV